MMSMSMTPREGHTKLVPPSPRADFPGLHEQICTIVLRTHHI
jgi:hypothetical protein